MSEDGATASCVSLGIDLDGFYQRSIRKLKEESQLPSLCKRLAPADSNRFRHFHTKDRFKRMPCANIVNGKPCIDGCKYSHDKDAFEGMRQARDIGDAYALRLKDGSYYVGFMYLKTAEEAILAYVSECVEVHPDSIVAIRRNVNRSQARALLKEYAVAYGKSQVENGIGKTRKSLCKRPGVKSADKKITCIADKKISPNIGYIYVLRLAGNRYYVGITDSLRRRLFYHTSGRGSKWTRLHSVSALVDVVTCAPQSYEDPRTWIAMDETEPDLVRGGSSCFCNAHIPGMVSLFHRLTNLPATQQTESLNLFTALRFLLLGALKTQGHATQLTEAYLGDDDKRPTDVWQRSSERIQSLQTAARVSQWTLEKILCPTESDKNVFWASETLPADLPPSTDCLIHGSQCRCFCHQVWRNSRLSAPSVFDGYYGSRLLTLGVFDDSKLDHLVWTVCASVLVRAFADSHLSRTVLYYLFAIQHTAEFCSNKTCGTYTGCNPQSRSAPVGNFAK